MATLEIKRDVRDSAVVVAVVGDIDTATVDTLVTNLETALKAASERLAVIVVSLFPLFGR